MTDERNDVPAGCWVRPGASIFPDLAWEYGVDGIPWSALGARRTRADAIAACRGHARRVAEGSELVAELRAEVNESRARYTFALHMLAKAEEQVERMQVDWLDHPLTKSWWATAKRLVDRVIRQRDELRAEVERISEQRLQALQDMEQAQRKVDALENEVERMRAEKQSVSNGVRTVQRRRG